MIQTNQIELNVDEILDLVETSLQGHYLEQLEGSYARQYQRCSACREISDDSWKEPTHLNDCQYVKQVQAEEQLRSLILKRKQDASN